MILNENNKIYKLNNIINLKYILILIFIYIYNYSLKKKKF